jgi:hypothetical protein
MLLDFGVFCVTGGLSTTPGRLCIVVRLKLCIVDALATTNATTVITLQTLFASSDTACLRRVVLLKLVLSTALATTNA